MSKETKIGVTVAAVVLILGGIWLGRPAETPKTSPPTAQNPSGQNPGQNPSYGSLTGPDIPFPYLNWGGVYQYSFSQATAATSSIPCQFGSATTSGQAWPVIGTSTILSASITYSASGLGAQNVDISTTTINAVGGLYGSSTVALVRNRVLGANQDAVVWTPISTTTVAASPVLNPIASTGDSLAILKPGEGVTFRIATATAGTFATYLTGTCTLRLQVI